MIGTNAEISMTMADADANLSPVHLIYLIQDCELKWLETTKNFADWLSANGCGMMLASRQVDIYRMPRLFEKVSIRTSVFGAKASLGFRNTGIYDESGELMVATRSIGAWVNLTDGSMMRLPDEVIATLGLEDEVPMDVAPRKVKLPKVEAHELPSHVVGRSYLDINRHVNNAEFLRLAWDALPEGFTFDRIRMEYKAQGHLGDVVIPKVYEADGKVTVELAPEAGKTPFFIGEFSTIG